MITQNLDGTKICWKGGATGFSSRPNVFEYPPTLWMDRWSRDQPQPGSLFQRLREAEKRDPGNEVGKRHLENINKDVIDSNPETRLSCCHLGTVLKGFLLIQDLVLFCGGEVF